MELQEVEQRFRHIIQDVFDVPADKIHLGTRFLEDLGADSLAFVELITDMEETFEVKIPQEDLRYITTVGDALTYIRNRVTELATHTPPLSSTEETS